MRVTKDFAFEAAHRLSNYKGKCERIHGHNYVVRVTCEGTILDEAGILVDFNRIKQAVTDLIDVDFDHKLILNTADKINTDISTVIPNDWIVWVDYNPTAENMAKHFLDILRTQIKEVKEVTVYETPDSYATASF